MKKENRDKALGIIESEGLLPIIEAADVMAKTADVEIIDKEEIGAGLVVVMIVGDVASVNASVLAAKASVEKLGYRFVSTVIPRLHSDVWEIIP